MSEKSMFKKPQMAPEEIKKEIEDGVNEHRESMRWEDKQGHGEKLYRDGKGNLYAISNEATHYDPYKQGFGEWTVGGIGTESPNTPFEFMVWSEDGTYVKDTDSDYGQNLCGYGGLHFPIAGWREKLSEWSFPPEINDAITKAIQSGIERFKRNQHGHYSEDVVKRMLEKMEN